MLEGQQIKRRTQESPMGNPSTNDAVSVFHTVLLVQRHNKPNKRWEGLNPGTAEVNPVQFHVFSLSPRAAGAKPRQSQWGVTGSGCLLRLQVSSRYVWSTKQRPRKCTCCNVVRAGQSACCAQQKIARPGFSWPSVTAKYLTSWP